MEHNLKKFYIMKKNKKNKRELFSKFRLIREYQHITRSEVAVFAGVSVSNISLIERGLNIPNLRTAMKCAKYLGVTVEQLFSID